MTKTTALKKVRAELRYGYYRPGLGQNPVAGTGALVYAKCPVCRQRIDFQGMSWDSLAKLMQGLRGQMVDHLLEEHP